MRVTRAAAVLAGVMMMSTMAGGLRAQGRVPRLFASSADVQAMIAKAKAERKPDQANYSQPIVEAPHSPNLEYRVAGLNAPATIHDKDDELFYVVGGSGSLVTGGTLKDGHRTNADNSAGTGIEGVPGRRVSAGDIFLVPAGTPHWFTEIDGALVLMSLHIPK